MIKAIAACDSNFGIGKGNDIPWHIPEDFKYFKAQTTGHVILMGSNTWNSLPGKLPNRINVVASKQFIDGPDITLGMNNPGNVLEAIETQFPDKDIWICGGGIVYTAYAKFVTELHLTRIQQNYNCDVKFPIANYSHLQLVETNNIIADLDVEIYR